MVTLFNTSRRLVLTVTTMLAMGTASMVLVQGSGLTTSETVQLPECHSTDWVRNNAITKESKKGWNGVLDEAKWGTPAPNQVLSRAWNWDLSDDQWREAVQKHGEGKREDVTFDLWIPENTKIAKGVVAISGHGSGEALFKHPELRKIAQELGLALFKFIGNPVQRGFWPKSLLYERLTVMGQKLGHQEVGHAPLFLYGHSNGTGFSAVFPATESSRVWGWVSMRPGVTFQVYQPGAAQVPGLVIFGEEDKFLTRPSVAENLAVVEVMRKKHGALWNYAVEPKTGHGPGNKTWPLVFSFLRHTFTARVPTDANPSLGPVKLKALSESSGHLGRNWDPTQGGYQTLLIDSFANFTADKSTASWLINADYATDWQNFQAKGQLERP